jgi:hypothetical protein
MRSCIVEEKTYPLRNMALPSILEKVQFATSTSTVPEKIIMIALGMRTTKMIVTVNANITDTL